jgi:hypothetical protein
MGRIEEDACMMTIICRNDNTQRASNHHTIRSGRVRLALVTNPRLSARD